MLAPVLPFAAILINSGGPKGSQDKEYVKLNQFAPDCISLLILKNPSSSSSTSQHIWKGGASSNGLKYTELLSMRAIFSNVRWK